MFDFGIKCELLILFIIIIIIRKGLMFIKLGFLTTTMDRPHMYIPEMTGVLAQQSRKASVRFDV